MQAKTFPISENKITISINELQKLLDKHAFSLSLKKDQVEIQEIDWENQLLSAYEEAKNAPESDFVELTK